MRRTVIILAAGVLAATGAPAPADGPRPVSRELAAVLDAARADLTAGRHEAAATRLAGWRGDDHAVRRLLLGHAYLGLDRPDAAGREYERALAMDGTLSSAGVALAQVRATQKRWDQAAALLGRHAKVDSCPADVLLLYATVARRREDRRLGRLLVDKGLLRFPGDERFRRLDVALLAETGRHAAAADAALRSLRSNPADGAAWQRLAAFRDAAGDADGSLAALEAAVLCDPADLSRRRLLMAAQLARGDFPSVLAAGKALLAGARAKAAVADTALMELLIAAADMGAADPLLAGWLRRVPAARRTRAMRLAEARLALRRAKPDQARKALGKLIALGETDPAVFLWAGHLAEQADDLPAAETLYGQARRLKGPRASLATLYLARLYLRSDRAAEAGRLLKAHLDADPADAPARALLALAEDEPEGESPAK